MSSRHRTKAGAFAAVVGWGVLSIAGTSSAHHPEVEAHVVCVAGDQARVVVDTYSWAIDDPARMTNPDILVTIGSQSQRGSFSAANGYRFQVSFDVPADGARYVVRSTSAAPWGMQGEWGSVGDYRETAVVVPGPCPGAASSVSVTSPTPAAGAPSGGSSTAVIVAVPDDATKTPVGMGLQGGVLVAPPTSAIEVRIIGTVETRPAPTVEVQGAVQFQTLPHTGTDPRPFVALGIVLATIGVLLDSLARRRHPAHTAD